MAERERGGGGFGSKVYKPAPVERRLSRFDKRPRSPSPATSLSHRSSSQTEHREALKDGESKRTEQKKPRANIDIASVDPHNLAAIAQAMGFDGFNSTKVTAF